MNQAYIVLGLFAVIIVILVKEWLPIGVVGLGIPFFLVLFKICSASTAMGYFISETAVLIPCVYVMGEALQEVGVADKLGQAVLAGADRFSKGGKDRTEVAIFVMILLGSGVASFLLPRYGVTGAFMAVMVAVARKTKISRTKLMLILALAANIWGNNTLVATPPNMLANGVLETAGARTFGFFEFGLIGIPIAIAGSITLILMRRHIPANIDEEEVAKTEQQMENAGTGRIVPRWRVIATIVVFILFYVLIMVKDDIGIPATVSGPLCVAVILGMNVMTEKHAHRIVGWDVAIFCAGMQAFGKAIEVSGAGELIASGITSVIGSNPSPFLITFVLFITAAFMTQFMSNTGAAALLFPIGLSLALQINADPRAVVMAVTMGCGASFMTPMATTSNTMVVGIGGIRFRDFVTTGIPLMIVTALVCTIGIPLIWPFY